MIYFEKDFDPVHTFECGQCFRWNASDDDPREYTGIVGDKVCCVRGNRVFCPDSDNAFWENYFCTDIDYGKIKAELSEKDENLRLGTEYGHGIRILRQDIWETTVSFIISANNNIPRIKRIIETLSREFGKRIDDEHYSFPTAARLAELDVSELACLKAGYRDKYIMDAAEKVAGGEVDIDALPEMTTDDAKRELMKIKGIGGKVADCILLFSMSRYEVFPKDVWIKWVISELYGVPENAIDAFVSEKFGGLAGYAQQYLYYYAREKR